MNKSIFTRPLFFVLALLIGSGSIALYAYSKANVRCHSRIMSLNNKLEQLHANNIKRMRFTALNEQPSLGGWFPKFVVKNQFGKRYIVKIVNTPLTSIAHRVLTLFGVNNVNIERIRVKTKIVKDNEVLQATIQPYWKNDGSLMGEQNDVIDPSQLHQNHKRYLLKNKIATWVTGNFENGADKYLIRNNKKGVKDLITIDNQGVVAIKGWGFPQKERYTNNKFHFPYNDKIAYALEYYTKQVPQKYWDREYTNLLLYQYIKNNTPVTFIKNGGIDRYINFITKYKSDKFKQHLRKSYTAFKQHQIANKPPYPVKKLVRKAVNQYAHRYSILEQQAATFINRIRTLRRNETVASAVEEKEKRSTGHSLCTNIKRSIKKRITNAKNKKKKLQSYKQKETVAIDIRFHYKGWRVLRRAANDRTSNDSAYLSEIKHLQEKAHNKKARDILELYKNYLQKIDSILNDHALNEINVRVNNKGTPSR